MKKIIKQFLFCALSLSALTFVSCDSDDDATGSSTLEVAQGVEGTIALTAPLAGTQTVNEVDGETFEYTITLNKPQAVDIHVSVKQIAGSADEDDIAFDHEVVIPAYATTATGTVTILNDCTPEGVEDVTLQIGFINTSNATVPSSTVSFTINNSISNDLDLTFDFDHAFSISGDSYTLCGIEYDMDFYLFDSGMNDTGNYGAATVACPEHLTLDLSTLADDTYYIYYDVYDDAGLSGVYHDPFQIPVTVTYGKCGAIADGTFVQEDAFVVNSTAGSGMDYVVTIEVVGGIATLKNSNDEIIASGRNADKVKAAIEKARKNRRK